MFRIVPLVAGALLASGCARTPPVAAPPGFSASPVALNPADASMAGLGALRYRGGLVLRSTDPDFGELSALRWDASSGQFLAVSDTGNAVALRPIERGGRLVDARLGFIRPLHGENGAPLATHELGDAESLTADGKGGWLVGFERQHRILRYGPLIDGPATRLDADPQQLLEPLASNEGIEAMAGTARDLFLCAERQPAARANCTELRNGSATPVSVSAPPAIDSLGGVPTDADTDRRGNRYILFRSYSPAQGSGAAVVRIGPNGQATPLAVFRPPVTVDNMEGLAVRSEGGRTMLYLLSDDNRSAKQRTLLLKFELRD